MWLKTARDDEWEKMIGALETSSAASIVDLDTWDKSTSMPVAEDDVILEFIEKILNASAIFGLEF